MERLVRSSWSALDVHRRVRTAALRELGPETLRGHHDRVVGHVERLIHFGRDAGVFRADLPVGWLIATFYAVLHAAADEVDAGRLSTESAPEVLVSTLRSLLRAP